MQRLYGSERERLMKIALVTPYDYPYPGGVTEHIRHLDREFRARGHDTRIIAPSTELQEALPANVIKVNGDILPVPVNGSMARINLSPEVARRVKEILDAEQFDIIHLHEPEVPLLGWAVLHASRAVNVGTFHAYSENHTFDEYTQPLMAWVQAQLDGRIFVSPAVRESLASLAAGEYRVIPNGIDYARFAQPTLKPIPTFVPTSSLSAGSTRAKAFVTFYARTPASSRRFRTRACWWSAPTAKKSKRV